MGCCSARCMLIPLCCLHITALHFFYMVMVILGRFGVIQYRSRYVFMYLLWTLLWVGWNVFVSCLYLDLGGLSKISHISVIIRDPHSVRSQIQFTITSSLPVVSLQHIDVSSLGVSSHCSGGRTPVRGTRARAFPEQNQQNPQLTTVLSWLEYQYIEILHRIVQLLVSLPGFVYAFYIVSTFSEEEDSCMLLILNNHTCKVVEGNQEGTGPKEGTAIMRVCM
ncbi:sodium/potassium-transporting ATPase subunit beta-1-interacting protein 3 [Gasterosteus aculeatus]